MRQLSFISAVFLNFVLLHLAYAPTMAMGLDRAQNWSNAGTLVIVGVGSDGIAIAADGKTCQPDGTTCNTVQKLLPFGKSGAVGFVGRLSGELKQNDRQIASIDVLEIAQHLMPKASHMELDEAFNMLVEAVAKPFRLFMAQAPDLEQDSTKPIFRIIVTGYLSGAPIVWRANCYGKSPEHDLDHLIEQKRTPANVGDVYTFGKWLVSEELLHANSDSLRTFNNEPPAEKVRNAISLRRRNTLTSEDFLRWSEVCLRATESPEGQTYDKDPAVVGPPNQFGVITASGLKWLDVNSVTH